jgi:hypothetical protein
MIKKEVEVKCKKPVHLVTSSPTEVTTPDIVSRRFRLVLKQIIMLCP